MARLNKTPLTLRVRRGTAAQITATSPAPYQREGELAYATDTGGFYISNGTQFVLYTGALTAVNRIIAGTNISISPAGGTGDVTINATTALVPEPTGYGSFYSNVSQPITTINTPQAVTLGSTYEAVGTSTSGSRIYMDKAGTYQFSYVAQVANDANSQEYAEFWIKYNGVEYPNSNTKLILQPRKSSTEPSEQLMTLIISGTSLNDNDYIELFWEATSTQVSLKYDPANASYPATPSIIANIIPIGAQGRDSNLNELNDVLITTPSTGQLLRRDSDGLWKNWTPNFLTTVPTLDQVTTAGNTTTNHINVGTLGINTTPIGSDAFAGNSVFSIVAPAGARERLIFAKVADSSSYFSVFNTTSSSSQFLPMFAGYHGAGQDRTGMLFHAAVPEEGSKPALSFRASNNDYETALVNRPLFHFGGGIGGNTSKMMIWPDGTIAMGDNVGQVESANTKPGVKLYVEGNVGIGTTTDLGYKLDVNGTARVSSTLYASGFYSTSSSAIAFGYNGENQLYYNNFNLYPRFARALGNNGNISQHWSNLFLTGYAHLVDSVSSLSSYNSSAKLQVDSTTKGFLQPRMTNAQAGAIATPATGLQVYDTTNNKNLLYNGTVWQNIATESWVTAQGYLTSAPTPATPTLDAVTTAGNTTTNAITVGGLTVATNLIYTDTVGGRVGIGTVTPLSKLHIETSTSDTEIFRAINPGGGASVNRGAGIIVTMLNTQVTGGRTRIRQYDTAGYAPRNYIEFVSGTTGFTTEGSTTISGYYEVGLVANNALRLLVKPTGNILIGTTTDSVYKLDVVGADSRFNGVRVGLGAGGVSTNTVVGNGALSANSTGSSITAIGYRALYNNTASGNTAVGYEAALTNTSGVNITAFGERALRNSTGSENSAFGTIALFTNTTGIQNTAVGRAALFSNSTGGTNTGVGYNALFANSTGNSNTAIGWRSLSSNTGSNNTALGLEAGFSGVANTTGANNIFIGYQSTGVSATESNRTWIGNSSTTSTWLAGNVLVGTTTDAGFKLDVNGTARSNALYVQNGIGDYGVRIGTTSRYAYTPLTVETSAGSLSFGTVAQFTQSRAETTYVANYDKPTITLANVDLTADTWTTIQFSKRTDTASGIAGIGAQYKSSSNSDLAFFTKGSNTFSEKMRITGVGNVGIGTTTPAYKLQVQGTVSAVLTNATHPDVVYYNNTTGELTYGAAPTGGGGGGNFVIDYDYNIVGAKDGINTNFSTTVPYILGTTRVYLNGQRLTPGVGYDYLELNPTQISLFSPPVSSDQLIIEYETT